MKTTINLLGVALVVLFSSPPTAKAADCNVNGVTDSIEVRPTTKGLAGGYYKDRYIMDASTLVYGRIDATVNFDWGTTGFSIPGSTYVFTDNFAIRWTGSVLTTAAAGDYLFEVEHDNGVRLWVNGRELISQWDDSTGTHSGTITLAANTKYPIRLDYNEGTGPALVKLRWRAPGGATTDIIPNANLFTAVDQNANFVLDMCELTADCNGNFIEDATDIANGTSMDMDGNGIPDECVPPVTGACCLGTSPCQAGKTSAWCSTMHGVYMGDNSDCEACRGACCIMTTGACTDGVWETNCTGPGFYFNGEGTTCASLGTSCDKSGACCDLATGNCTEGVQEMNCSSTGLYFNGIGSMCPPTNSACRDCNKNGILDGTELLYVNQSGLLAAYYSGTNFNTLVITRLDADVNHDPTDDSWPLGADLPSGDDFSVRWVGTLKVTTAGNYTFRLRIDDGAALWLDGKVIIGQMGRIGAPNDFYSAPIALDADTFHTIRLDYNEYWDQQVVVLSWLTPDAVDWAVIPPEALFSPQDANNDGVLDGCSVVGACCLSPYGCQITTQANCAGTYKGDNTTCSECPQVPGACCNATTGICTDNVLQSYCQPPLRFGGGGSTCATLSPPCAAPVGCTNQVPGDMDQSGVANGLDIQGFVNCALGVPGSPNCACGDFDNNGQTNSQDISGLLTALLGSAPATCTLLGDLYPDGVVDGKDIQGLTDCIIGGGTSCSCGDLNGDSQVNTEDIPAFLTKLLGP